MANLENKQEATKVDEALVRSEAFFFRYQKTIITAIIVIVVAILGSILYHFYVAIPHSEKASTAISKAQQYFQENDYQKALNGDGANLGFLQVIDQYGGTDAANLAHLYAGLCYAQTGKYKEAIPLLEDFSSDDEMVGPAAKGTLGDCYAHVNRLDDAVKAFKEAADKADNNSISPMYLVKAGEILEYQKKPAEALKCYQKVKDSYPQSMQAMDIDKYIQRAGGNQITDPSQN